MYIHSRNTSSINCPAQKQELSFNLPTAPEQQKIIIIEDTLPCYKKISLKVGKFLKENWKKILLYLVAWILIIACYGAICGFAAVALPFTIWMSISFGLGFVFGIITAVFIDPKNKWKEKNSLWDLMNLGLLQLDENGTRQVLLASVITVISTALTAFPKSLGGFIGFCAGNQLAVKMCYGLRLGASGIKSLSKTETKKIKDLENSLITTCLIKDNLLIKMQNLELKKRIEKIEHPNPNTIKTQNATEPTIVIETGNHILESQATQSEQLEELNNKMRKCDIRINGINACLQAIKNH